MGRSEKSNFSVSMTENINTSSPHRCLVFLEEQAIFQKYQEENKLKIEAQQILLENIRRQIDILKTNCL